MVLLSVVGVILFYFIYSYFWLIAFVEITWGLFPLKSSPRGLRVCFYFVLYIQLLHSAVKSCVQGLVLQKLTIGLCCLFSILFGFPPVLSVTGQ